jgi:hypothetical protein
MTLLELTPKKLKCFGPRGPILTMALWSTACLGTDQALASPITATAKPCVNATGTCVTVAGPGASAANEGISVTYIDATTGKPTTTAAPPLNGIGLTTVSITPKSGTPIIASDTTEKTVAPGLVADTFTPGTNQVVSAYAINSGSSINFQGNTYLLSGGYTLIDTDVVYDSTSPAFGTETGFLAAVNVSAVGPMGDITFTLSSVPSYTANLASIWAIHTLPATIPIPTSVALDGTLTLDGMSVPFTGTLSDLTTFNFDGSNTDLDSLNLSTSFGAITGTVSATTLPQLVPIPEPRTLSLALASFSCLAIMRLRRRCLKSEDNR